MTVLPPRRVVLILGGLAFLLLLLSNHANAQAPFSNCAARTATNASLVLPSDLAIVVNGEPIPPPWRIALFTPDGHCAGSTLWTGEASALTVWGTSTNRTAALVSPANTLSPGDSMHVRLFHPSSSSSYSAQNSRITVSFRTAPPPVTTQPEYVPGSIYVLDRIQIRRTLVSRPD